MVSINEEYKQVRRVRIKTPYNETILLPDALLPCLMQQKYLNILTYHRILGRVTNIPQSMVTDQFGMIGLLTFIRAAETDPNLVSLALGADLTTLGLNLNSEVNLYPTFGGPWAETPCRPQDIDFHVPYEYLTNTTIR